MPFGKHKGVDITKVDVMYLLWLFKQPWLPDKYPEIYQHLEGRAEELDKARIDDFIYNYTVDPNE